MYDAPLSTGTRSRSSFPRTLLMLLTLLIASMLGANAYAGTPSEGGPKALTERGEQWDTNGDGELDAAEKTAARTALIRSWDRDGDGRLSRDERAAARAAGELPTKRVGPKKGHDDRVRAARKQSNLERFDANHDGEISPEEVAAEIEKPAAARAAARYRANVKKYDADGDGVLNEEERSRARRENRHVSRRDVDRIMAEAAQERLRKKEAASR